MIRPARAGDISALTNLLRRESFVHRHLGWGSELDWIGQQPFLVRVEDQEIIAALAVPPDQDGPTWLRLFAVAPQVSIHASWNELWPAAQDWLVNCSEEDLVSCLLIQPELKRMLNSSGFILTNQVKVLFWDISQAVWPQDRHQYQIREMEIEDFTRIQEIDAKAFNPIWRQSLIQLKIAYQQASSAKVVLLKDRIAGYQISTSATKGGHLARLAVDPGVHGLGLGNALLDDLLNEYLNQGVVEVSVNTQADNIKSLNLYKKFGFLETDENYPVYQHYIRGNLSD
jgi:ribosomal protein S18 acetylase RimI-like enzyme